MAPPLPGIDAKRHSTSRTSIVHPVVGHPSERVWRRHRVHLRAGNQAAARRAAEVAAHRSHSATKRATIDHLPAWLMPGRQPGQRRWSPHYAHAGGQYWYASPFEQRTGARWRGDRGVHWGNLIGRRRRELALSDSGIAANMLRTASIAATYAA
jgi:hypothetical protein